jgi:hypothetical protein
VDPVAVDALGEEVVRVRAVAVWYRKESRKRFPLPLNAHSEPVAFLAQGR